MTQILADANNQPLCKANIVGDDTGICFPDDDGKIYLKDNELFKFRFENRSNFRVKATVTISDGKPMHFIIDQHQTSSFGKPTDIKNGENGRFCYTLLANLNERQKALIENIEVFNKVNIKIGYERKRVAAAKKPEIVKRSGLVVETDGFKSDTVDGVTGGIVVKDVKNNEHYVTVSDFECLEDYDEYNITMHEKIQPVKTEETKLLII